jgi:DNA-binding NarL/FixJ family response regulator
VKVVAYVPDLMDRSKVAAAPADVTFVRQPGELAGTAAAESADLVVVDVTRPGAIEAVAAMTNTNTKIIAFSKHTNREAMDAATAAGADQVLARSAFFARINDLLAG